MKQFVNRVFNKCADSLVTFSRRFGRQTWLLFLLIFSFTITTIIPPVHSSVPKFNDIQGHWAQLCIQQLGQRKILTSYRDGSFRPNLPVTRAEFAVIMNKAFPNAPKMRRNGKFVDIPEIYWGIVPIREAYQTRFMRGYPDEIFEPSQDIPRVQVLVALAAGLNYLPELPEEGTGEAIAYERALDHTLKQHFTDASAIPKYAKNGVVAALNNKLIINYPNVRQLKPNELATRGEVAAAVCQALKSTQVIPSEYIANSSSKTNSSAELRGVWLTNIDSDVLFSKLWDIGC